MDVNCFLIHLTSDVCHFSRWSRRRGDYYDESTWNAVTDRHLMLASMSLQSAFSSFPKGGNEFFNRVLGQATNILFAEQYPELRGYFREQLGPGLIGQLSVPCVLLPVMNVSVHSTDRLRRCHSVVVLFILPALAPTAAEQFLPAELRLLELAESTFTPELHQSIAPETWEKMQWVGSRKCHGRVCGSPREPNRVVRSFLIQDALLTREAVLRDPR